MWTDTHLYKHSGCCWSSWPFQGMRDRKLQGTQDSFIHLIIQLLKKYSLSTLSYQTLWSKECPLGNSSIGIYPTTEHTCPNHIPLLPPTPLLLDSRTSLAPVFLYLGSFFGHQSPLCSPHDGCFHVSNAFSAPTPEVILSINDRQDSMHYKTQLSYYQK